jgi:hypothetical protein
MIESLTDSKLRFSSWRWAFGFFQAFCRSLSATSTPMWSGAPERRM